MTADEAELRAHVTRLKEELDASILARDDMISSADQVLAHTQAKVA